MSPQANKISSIKRKRNPKLKKQETGAATRNDFFLETPFLRCCIKNSMYHCILLIGTISNENPYQ